MRNLMMKLNKANNDGTISVTIPKQTAKELGWVAGQEVDLLPIDDVHLMVRNNVSLLERDGGYPRDYTVEEILNKLRETVKTAEEVYLNSKMLNSSMENVGIQPVDMSVLIKKSIGMTLSDIIDRVI